MPAAALATIAALFEVVGSEHISAVFNVIIAVKNQRFWCFLLV
jgi:hypothetical protein